MNSVWDIVETIAFVINTALDPKLSQSRYQQVGGVRGPFSLCKH